MLYTEVLFSKAITNIWRVATNILHHRLWQDARFWIALFFVARLYGITQPPLEVVHNWRQATVAMVARNFYEVDNNILYPRLDIGGSGTGIEGMEFPLLNYLIYCTSEIAGYQHWYGRLINLIISSIAVWYFFLLVKKYWNEKMALYSVIILQSSLWFLYMRKMMPDTFSASLVIIGVYYGCKYLNETKNYKSLLLYLLFIGAGMLSKISSVSLCVVLLLPFFTADTKRKLLFGLATLIWIVPVAWWYFIWVPYLNDHFGTGHFFMGVKLSEGTAQLLQGIPTLLSFFYDHTLKYIGFIVFTFGIAFALYKKEKQLLLIVLLSLSVLLLVLAKGGSSGLRHDYYMVPFAPVMALVAAYALYHIKWRWTATILLFAISAEGILNQYHDFRIKDGEANMLALEGILDEVNVRNDLVAINSNKVPTPMYFAHRKGWLCSNEQLQSTDYITQLKSEGLKNIVVMKIAFDGDCDLPYSIVYEDDVVKVFKP